MTDAKPPELLRTDEANELLRSIGDPITAHLTNNAMYQFIRMYHLKKQFPSAPFDLRFFLDVMLEVFKEHNVLRRILDGEHVGSLYDDELLRTWTQGL